MTVPDVGTPVASVPTIWGNVPQRNKNFTGRVDILARLRQGASSRITAVLPEEDPDDPLPRAVQGLGGVGKTAIAIEYAYRHRSDYDLVWWIAADQLTSVRSSLALQHSHRLSRSVERRSGPCFCCRLVARCGAFSRSFTSRTEAGPALFISVR